MNNSYDAIVIGAGHNGLTAAAYLAQAGRRVLVLEKRQVVGGTVVTEEVFPGFNVDACQHRGQLAAEVVRDLDLTRHGLQVVYGPGLLALLPDGEALWLSPNTAQASRAIARFSPSDADRWPAFVARLSRIARWLREAYMLTMPRLPNLSPSEAPAFAQLALKLRGLGKKEMMETLRLLPMSARELLDEWFESEPLRGALAALGVHGLTQGPMAAGTAFNLLHQWILHDGPFKATTRGGLGQITQALASAARRFGVEIRIGAEVAEICVQDGRATGVRLASGETISARCVASAADPKRTFLGLVDGMELDPHFVHAVQCVKLRGSAAKLNLALDGLPTFNGVTEAAHLRGTIVISPSVAYLERAFDAAKYGGISAQPYLEITLPTLADPSLAPVGKHVMSVHIQYVPYKQELGDAYARSEIERMVMETLSLYVPNLQSLITDHQLVTPLDLETTYSLTEGNLNHGEMMLDQILFMRPVPGWAQYRTPIDGLFLCGPGTHPGGGVSGLSGRNAAKQILKDIG